MVSNNVWVEATVHPESAKQIDLGWNGVAEPLDKLHVTMAFTKLRAADFRGEPDRLWKLRERLVKSVVDLPEFGECDGFDISGAAVLQPGKGDFGVLLLSSHVLCSYHTRLAQELKIDHTLDLTYPGWLPHITLCEGVTNYHDIEALHKLSRNVDAIKLDGLWLRAGRMCVPL